jgi:hypothetical protein
MAQPKVFYRLYPKDGKEALFDEHNFADPNEHGFVFVYLPKDDNPKKFYYFETLEEAEAYIGNHGDPRFSSVMLPDRPVRFNIELDMEHDKLDLITLDARTQKLVDNHNASQKIRTTS